MSNLSTIYLSKKELIEALGTAYRKQLKSLLNGLKKEGFISSYDEYFKIQFRKDMASHIQSLMHFQENGITLYKVPRKPNKGD